MTTATKRDRKMSKIVRDAAGCAGDSFPSIEIIPGTSAPRQRGSSYFFTNISGDIIHHPSAYRRAFGKPIYNSSSRYIEVGSDWIAVHVDGIVPERYTDAAGLSKYTPLYAITDKLEDIGMFAEAEFLRNSRSVLLGS